MPNVDHAVTVHQENARILERHIPTDSRTPKWDKVSVQTRCQYCSNRIYTRVEGKVSQNGIGWAILCCFFGNILLSLLVFCLDGFKVYRHFCPSCNAFIAEYSPEMSCGIKVLLTFLSLLFVGLTIYLVMRQLTGNFGQ